MILSIDATGLGPVKTGTSVYVLEIIREWNKNKKNQNKYYLFISKKTQYLFDGLELDQRFKYQYGPDNRMLRTLWQQIVLPLKLTKIKSNVHWGTAFVLPVFSKKKMVVTIHDLTFQLYPEVHERLKRIYFPWMIKTSVKKADAIITNSETTKTDLINIYSNASKKTHVTLLGVRQLLSNYNKPNNIINQNLPYVLALGTLEPRKNIHRLIQSWCGLSNDIRKKYHLLICGTKGWMINDLEKYSGRESSGITFLGHVPEEDLSYLLKHATALAYPSLYEGFGLPVIEAMSLGVPVLTSNIGATKEVAGDSAILVDPDDIESIKNGLEKLLSNKNLQEDLSRKGMNRASLFTWHETAEKTLFILEQVNKNS